MIYTNEQMDLLAKMLLTLTEDKRFSDEKALHIEIAMRERDADMALEEFLSWFPSDATVQEEFDGEFLKMPPPKSEE